MHSPRPETPLSVVYRLTAALRDNPRNARTHSKRQVRQIADSIRAFGFVCPLLINEAGVLVAGHARLAAARLLALEHVPTICAVGLSDVQQRAYMLADNQLATKSGWDRGRLAAEFGELLVVLPPLGLDLGVTGFEPPDIDLILHDLDQPRPDPGDRLPALDKVAVTRSGDLWRLGPHSLLCGDARSAADVDRLMAGKRARMVFTDPPYNVPIANHVQGRGRVRHPEFAFGSGEMNSAEFTTFLETCFRNLARVSMDGAIVYSCMDWRHIAEVNAAGRAAFTRLMNVVVWNKTSPGQGYFYRSQHEFIFVFKVGEAEHINTFGLGAGGRTRSNVWTYPGGSSFHAGRADELAMHPTTKPVALVADALRDCSIKSDVVLDVFGGSGTTLLAAEKLGRCAHVLEYEPRYVDVTIQRWEAYTKLEAVLDQDGRTWSEVKAERLQPPHAAAAPSTIQAASQGSPESDGDEGAAWIALCGGES